MIVSGFKFFLILDTILFLAFIRFVFVAALLVGMLELGAVPSLPPQPIV